MSIFTQVWLWSVAAFAIGVLLTVLLLVLPARKQVKELQRRLTAAEAAPREQTRQFTPEAAPREPTRTFTPEPAPTGYQPPIQPEPAPTGYQPPIQPEAAPTGYQPAFESKADATQLFEPEPQREDAFGREAARQREETYGYEEAYGREGAQQPGDAYGHEDASGSEGARQSQEAYGREDAFGSEGARQAEEAYGREAAFGGEDARQADAYGRDAAYGSEGDRQPEDAYGHEDASGRDGAQQPFGHEDARQPEETFGHEGAPQAEETYRHEGAHQAEEAYDSALDREDSVTQALQPEATTYQPAFEPEPIQADIEIGNHYDAEESRPAHAREEDEDLHESVEQSWFSRERNKAEETTYYNGSGVLDDRPGSLFTPAPADEDPPAYAFSDEPEPSFEDELAAERTQVLPKRQPRPSPPGGFDPPQPIEPSVRQVERREPTPEQGQNSGSLFEPAVPAGANGTMPDAPPAREFPADVSVPIGPFGPGSAMPKPGGGRPSAEFTVKASVTALRYCTEDSPQFPRMVAEVWFRSETDAERVGFRPLG